MVNENVEKVCKNSRCITTVEKYVPQSFIETDSSKGTLRCVYCDCEYNEKGCGDEFINKKC